MAMGEKVLFVNMSLKGHHLEYLDGLTKIEGIQPTVILEEEDAHISAKQMIIKDVPFGSRKWSVYLKWMSRIRKIAEQVKPDTIHFVWGDSFYRFMGYGFGWLKKYNSVITFHQVRKTWMHKLSILIYGKIFRHVVVHTNFLYKLIKEYGVENLVHIEYPNFRKTNPIEQEEAKRKLGIETKKKILLCLGGTRAEKGLDILLEALKDVQSPFFLLVAGPEQNIKGEEIQQGIREYVEDTKIILRFLTFEEIELCYSGADYVVLPYRKEFDGASGPLAEGVGYGKCIIGPDHGSLGEIIRENHVGKCFSSEDVENLALTIEEALQEGFSYDSVAKAYQESLQPISFQRAYGKVYDRGE